MFFKIKSSKQCHPKLIKFSESIFKIDEFHGYCTRTNDKVDLFLELLRYLQILPILKNLNLFGCEKCLAIQPTNQSLLVIDSFISAKFWLLIG